MSQQNYINAPIGGFNVVAGQPITITWTNPSSGTVTIRLSQGGSTTGPVLVSAIPASAETATLTIPTNVNSTAYNFAIVDDTNSNNINFSVNFVISGGSNTQPPSSSKTTSEASTNPSSAAPSTESSALPNTSATLPNSVTYTSSSPPSTPSPSSILVSTPSQTSVSSSLHAVPSSSTADILSSLTLSPSSTLTTVSTSRSASTTVSSSSLSSGAAAGIGVGATVAFVAISISAYALVRRKRRQSKNNTNMSSLDNQSFPDSIGASELPYHFDKQHVRMVTPCAKQEMQTTWNRHEAGSTPTSLLNDRLHELHEEHTMYQRNGQPDIAHAGVDEKNEFSDGWGGGPGAGNDHQSEK